ncbi:hypothetical protein YC2023_023675 [Brassica napus]
MKFNFNESAAYSVESDLIIKGEVCGRGGRRLVVARVSEEDVVVYRKGKWKEMNLLLLDLGRIRISVSIFYYSWISSIFYYSRISTFSRRCPSATVRLATDGKLRASEIYGVADNVNGAAARCVDYLLRINEETDNDSSCFFLRSEPWT